VTTRLLAKFKFQGESFLELVITGSDVYSDCTVLTTTGFANGKWQILTPYRIETPEPIDIKFGTLWVVDVLRQIWCKSVNSGQISEIFTFYLFIGL